MDRLESLSRSVWECKYLVNSGSSLAIAQDLPKSRTHPRRIKRAPALT